MAEKFDPSHASKLENPARPDRPVGPPNDHAPAADVLHVAVADMAPKELATYEPGEIGLYHLVIAAQKPAS